MAVSQALHECDSELESNTTWFTVYVIDRHSSICGLVGPIHLLY